MATTYQQLIKEANSYISRAKQAEDMANFDTFPGAENDKPVPSDAKKPDPKVKEEGPASARTTDGAKPGSDAEPLNDHLYEADEPVLNPTKKDMQTADANAKEASVNTVTAIANKVLHLAVKKAQANRQAAQHGHMDISQAILSKIAEARNGALNPDLAKLAAAYIKGNNDGTNFFYKYAQAIQDAQDDAASERQGSDDALSAIGAAASAGGEDGTGVAGGDIGTDGDEEVPSDIQPDELVGAVQSLVEDGSISPDDGQQILGEVLSASDVEPSEEEIAEALSDGISSGEISPEQAQTLIGQLQSEGVDPSTASDISGDISGTCGDGTCDSDKKDEADGAAMADSAIQDAADEQLGEEDSQKAAEYTDALNAVNRANVYLKNRYSL